jgi:hypothetical protein
MSWIKLVTINIAIILSLIGGIVLVPPIVTYSYQIIFNSGIDDNDKRANLSLYEDYKWAKTHFNEFESLSTHYFDFITWRRKDFKGQTINIIKGNRKTYSDIRTQKSKKEFWFFGGSTTWGSGVDDYNTYPSLFAKATGVSSLNFGETGYIGRQSLDYLMNQFIFEERKKNSKKIHIVFYDGGNDVSYLCLTENSVSGTGRELTIKSLIEANRGIDKFKFQRTFSQVIAFFKLVNNKFSKNQPTFEYSCSTNSERARTVASNLVKNWSIANSLAKLRGAEFTAILQPVALIGSPSIDYLNLMSKHHLTLREQYLAVYPYILEYANNSDFNFLDLTQVYNNCANCYIDRIHVGPQAHGKLVNVLNKNLLP